MRYVNMSTSFIKHKRHVSLNYAADSTSLVLFNEMTTLIPPHHEISWSNEI
jgi:hypothetical protein